MPKSHDTKPRNKHRREKAAANNIIPALRFHKSERQLRRLRSRALTDAARGVQAQLEVWLRKHSITWREYELAFRTAKESGTKVGLVLMDLAASRGGTPVVQA